MSDQWKATEQVKYINKNGREVLQQLWVEVTQDENGVWVPTGNTNWMECPDGTLSK